MSKTIENLAMLLAKNAITKHLKMERLRILNYIETVHVENCVAIGYTENEIESMSGDILLLVIDAGNRISNLEKQKERYSRKNIQKLRRGLALLKSLYEEPMPRDEIGSTSDLEYFLLSEKNYATPSDGNSPIPDQGSTIGVNTGKQHTAT